MLVWWGSAVECVSRRRARAGDAALSDCDNLLPGGMRLIRATKSGKRQHDFSVYIRCVPPMRCN